MNIERLSGRLRREEGEVLHPYWDELGECWTGGVGHNLSAHCTLEQLAAILHDGAITPEQSQTWLEADIDEAYRDCVRLFPAFDSFSESRQEALVDLRFNLGPGNMRRGFRSFRRMIAAINDGEWWQAANECLDSDAARELASRYATLADMLMDG
jgi:GH24 family phage-related lysozyme (muramidase)